MPPRSSDMLSRADLGYEPAAPSSFDKGHSSMSNIKFTSSQQAHNNNNRSNSSKRLRPRTAGGPSEKGPVSFSMDSIKTVEVEHMDDLPGEDIWYSREEYDEIKGRNSNIVRLIKCGEFEENEELSCRGLEHKLKEVFRQRRANKFNALNAVLEEQDRQINRGITDAILISTAYQTVSVKCQESANTIAFRDYRFSFNYDPNKPATGFDQPIPPPDKSGDSQSSGQSQTKGGKDKDKKKKKKKEKKMAKEEKKMEKKLKKEEKKEMKKEKKAAKKIQKLEQQQLRRVKTTTPPRVTAPKTHAAYHHPPPPPQHVEDREDGEDDDDDDDEEDDDHDLELSPKSGHKKKKVRRRIGKGARRMMRRMSM